jgi:tRNA(Ile)-lysidine synthase
LIKNINPTWSKVGGKKQNKRLREMIFTKVLDTIKEYRLLYKNERVLVGVSGGPDSVALLYLLNGLKLDFKLKLHVAHFDHMLRKDSAKDAFFVKKLSEKLQIPFTSAKVRVKKLAQKGSLEEIARGARLAFLFQTAKKIKADKIALGHNIDDQAETVLMRILRGTGLYGLAGISPIRKISGFTVIRPLIAVSRKEIEAFLRKNKIKTRLDSTNLKNLYLRNRIRNRLLPLLEKEYNRNIKAVLANMGEIAAVDYDYLAYQAARASQNLGKGLNLKRFLRLHPAIQRLILRLNIAKLSGSTRRIGFQHIKEIEDMISHRPLNSVVDLPKGVSVIKKRSCLSFYKR